MRRTGALVDILAHWADRQPEKPFLVVGDSVCTFREMHDGVRAFAHSLAARGVVKGDRVAMMAPTSISSVTAMLGAAVAGAVIVPLNFYLKGEPLVHQLVVSGSRTIVTDGEGLEMIAGLVESLPDLESLILIGECDDPHRAGVDVVRIEQLVGGVALLPDPPATVADDVYGIIFTSGTTGLPKGCVISHGLTEQWAHYTERLCALREEDVIMTAAPLFHIGGQTPLFGGLACGLTVVMEAGFSATNYLPRAREVGATIAVGVGWIAQSLLKKPPASGDRDHSLRAMSTVQLSVEEQESFLERFGVRTLVQQYGQTECYPIAYNSFADQTISPYAGVPAPELEVSFLAEDGQEVAPGEVGEICVRPRRPHVLFEGYWENAEATVDAWKGLWFHTGDLGRLAEGQVQYVDRKKDSMRRRGENVSAFELERAILKFPAVAQVAVHAVHLADELDDSIKACVVLKPAETLDIEEFVAHMVAELPYFAVPQFLEVFDVLPTNAAGRVMKDELRALGLTDATTDLIAEGFGVKKSERRLSARSGTGIGR